MKNNKVKAKFLLIKKLIKNKVKSPTFIFVIQKY